MTNLIVRSSFQSDMKPIIKKWFGETYKNHDPLYSKISQVMSSSDAFETDALVLGMGTLVVKPEGQALSYDTSKQQWTPRYSHTTYALGYKISKEMISDGKAFKNAEKYTKMLKKAAMETRDIAAASVHLAIQWTVATVLFFSLHHIQQCLVTNLTLSQATLI
jgi:hypothetical protein